MSLMIRPLLCHAARRATPLFRNTTRLLPPQTSIRLYTPDLIQGDGSVMSQDHAKILPWKDKPVPEKHKELYPELEIFVADWIRQFPKGARLRRLQRDVCFRMMGFKKSFQGIDCKELLTLVGEMERKGVVWTRLKLNGIIVLMPNGTRSEWDTKIRRRKTWLEVNKQKEKQDEEFHDIDDEG